SETEINNYMQQCGEMCKNNGIKEISYFYFSDWSQTHFERAKASYIDPVPAITPGFLDFSDVPIGSTLSKTFIVENVGSGTLNVNVSTSGAFSIQGSSAFTLSADESANVTVAFSPTLISTYESSVVFEGDNFSYSRKVIGDGVSNITSPIIGPINDHSTIENSAYIGPTPSLSQGTLPVTWSIVTAPAGLTIDPVTGATSWPTPIANSSAYEITIGATNSAGYDDETWYLTVNVDTPIFVGLSQIYVDESATSGAHNGTDWANAFLTLQDALYAVAGDPNEIWVAAGTYYPTSDYGLSIGDRGRHFRMVNDVAIYGGFLPGGGTFADRNPNQYETILSGDIGTASDDSDNCYHVFYHPDGTNLDATAILDGFTITAGNADSSHPHYAGGGIYNRQSSPTVIGCTFTDNSAGIGGGMYNFFSNPTVTDCTFTGNSTGSGGSGGGMYNDSGSPTVSSCTFSDNSAASGGGMYNAFSNPTVISCTFTDNSVSTSSISGAGGGIFNSDSSPTITDCTFAGNLADSAGGGMFNIFSNPTVGNCTFTGNSAYLGGGMRNETSSPTVIGCTFTSNSAGSFSSGGGMVNLLSSSPRVISSTFTGNWAGEYGGGIYNRLNSSPTVIGC
ncbi:MAG: hypothetical protein KAR47_06790, partial [Planctomycetes bacterium]|nr:hypothetical protein [Planctomycetota bacterium]